MQDKSKVKVKVGRNGATSHVYVDDKEIPVNRMVITVLPDKLTRIELDVVADIVESDEMLSSLVTVNKVPR